MHSVPRTKVSAVVLYELVASVLLVVECEGSSKHPLALRDISDFAIF